MNPLAHEKTFEVKVPKTVKAGTSLTLSITDGATPPNEKLITVRVIAAPATTTPPANQADLTGDPLTSMLRQARDNGVPFSVSTADGKTATYTVMKVDPDAAGRAATLACKPVPASAPTRLHVRDALLGMLVSKFKLPQAAADKVKANPTILSLVAPAGCVK